jgi:hypothetical protein
MTTAATTRGDSGFFGCKKRGMESLRRPTNMRGTAVVIASAAAIATSSIAVQTGATVGRAAAAAGVPTRVS